MVIEHIHVFYFYRFQYFVCLSDVSCQDWPSQDVMKYILFKGDIPFKLFFFYIFF